MIKNLEKVVIVTLVSTMLTTFLVGCSQNNSNGSVDSSKKTVILTISGSTSVGPLVEEELAPAYKAKNPNVNIEIQQVGSGVGIKNAIDGTSQIGMSSRDLKGDEKTNLKPVEIALDGIATIVHANNKVNNLTIAELKDIYMGKITNWKDVGGKDAPIVVVGRESGSGTKSAFEELVGFKAQEIIKDSIVCDGNGNCKTTVANNENAIGYVSFEVIDKTIKAMNIEGVAASVENVKNKTYKLSRPFLLVYRDDKVGDEGKKFIDFTLTDEGQQLVEKKGGIKIK
jgi:phosphate transport system substrate-binding protein